MIENMAENMRVVEKSNIQKTEQIFHKEKLDKKKDAVIDELTDKL